MSYLKVFSDEAGETHFAEQPMGAVLEWDSRFTRLVRVEPGRTTPMHCEPAPTLATAIRGGATITTSDGASHRLEPGTAMLFVDTEGRGHVFANGDEETILLIARLTNAAARTSPIGP
ncbi:MAG: hypothetical protein ABJE95_08620 [Byssovorax sp.]